MESYDKRREESIKGKDFITKKEDEKGERKLFYNQELEYLYKYIYKNIPFLDLTEEYFSFPLVCFSHSDTN